MAVEGSRYAIGYNKIQGLPRVAKIPRIAWPFTPRLCIFENF